jgi:hypothetical protein
MTRCTIGLLVTRFLGLLMAPPIASAPGPGKSHRVGILDGRSAGGANIEALREGLDELGYREDHNLTLEYGVNVILPLPGVPECYPTFPVRMPDMRLAQVCPLPGRFPDCA